VGEGGGGGFGRGREKVGSVTRPKKKDTTARGVPCYWPEAGGRYGGGNLEKKGGGGVGKRKRPRIFGKERGIS